MTVSCNQPVAIIGLHFELQPDRSIITFSTLPPAVLEAPDAPPSALDREVLEALYHATGGSDWTDRTNWLRAAPLAEWFGVGTDGTGRVTRLDLSGNGLAGDIPPALGRLSHLERLNLGWRWDPGSRMLFSNQLSGPIPPELGGLANLQRLRLWGNRLSGPIPTQLGGLANLRVLHLGFNPDLTGMIPSSLQQLPLSTLALMATAVCAPRDAVFQAWLTTIDSFQSSGLTCGSPPDAMSSIDVAAFYTPAARRHAGGTAAIETEIDLMVAETNQAYRDSGVHQQISLVAREEVDYTEENGNGFVALDRLVNPTDGYMDEVHAIRDRSAQTWFT